MSPALPAPTVPEDVDLRDFPFMALDVVRLRDSDLAVLSTGDGFRSAVLLWCASWHQIPAASLPNDERMLASLAGFGRDLSGWASVRDEALRGFILCSDGRLYHPVVAEKAVDAWRRRETVSDVAEGKKDRQRRWRERSRVLAAQLRERGLTPPAGANLRTLQEMLKASSEETTEGVSVDASVGVSRDAQEMHKRRIETGIYLQDGNAVPQTDEGEKSEGTQQPAAKGAKSKARGSRIDPGWQPSDADRAFAISLGIPAADVSRHGAEFVDYWVGRAGAAGVKLDWPATWRNRCRQIAEHRGYRPVSSSPVSNMDKPPGWPSGLPAPETCFEAWQRGGWPNAWGFPPGDPSCRIPSAIVADWQRRRQEAA